MQDQRPNFNGGQSLVTQWPDPIILCARCMYWETLFAHCTPILLIKVRQYVSIGTDDVFLQTASYLSHKRVKYWRFPNLGCLMNHQSHLPFTLTSDEEWPWPLSNTMMRLSWRTPVSVEQGYELYDLGLYFWTKIHHTYVAESYLCRSQFYEEYSELSNNLFISKESKLVKIIHCQVLF